MGFFCLSNTTSIFYLCFDLDTIPDIKKVKNLSENQQKEKEGELILKKIKVALLYYR
jgi:hypothetical protein